MSKYRDELPLGNGQIFLTDGGMETCMIFHEAQDLPHFASFVLLETADGRETVRNYYRRFMAVAEERRLGFILSTATWRANPDWAARLGYDAESLDRINREAVWLLEDLRAGFEMRSDRPCLIEGAIGPRGDGYRSAERMTAREAENYHAVQIASLKAAGADLVTSFTMNYLEEAMGIAAAAKAADMPCVIGFTVETDGRMQDGTPIGHVIATIDAATAAYPTCYMINCAHPTHFAGSLPTEPWVSRIGAIRANASSLSHAELDESETLDIGDPADLARRYRALRTRLPRLEVIGGCCGTDHRHVGAIAAAIAA